MLVILPCLLIILIKAVLLVIISLCLRKNDVLSFVSSTLAILILIFSIVSFHFVFGGLSRLSFIILAFSFANLVFTIITYLFKKEFNNKLNGL